MSLDKRYYIVCDQCCERPDEPAADARAARIIAERDGFCRVGKRDLCEECFLDLPVTGKGTAT